MSDRIDLEAWADALLDEHRTAPKREQAQRTLLDDLDPATRLMVQARASAAPPVASGTSRTSAAAGPDEWVGKAQAMGGVLLAVLVLSLVLALLAG